MQLIQLNVPQLLFLGTINSCLFYLEVSRETSVLFFPRLCYILKTDGDPKVSIKK